VDGEGTNHGMSIQKQLQLERQFGLSVITPTTAAKEAKNAYVDMRQNPVSSTTNNQQ
jgi:hypothetical protein